MGGDAHDLEVVFRLVQLWLSLGAERPVVAQLQAAFQATPSHKFLPLMYQMASRLSAAKTGPLVASGFQVRGRRCWLQLVLPKGCFFNSAILSCTVKKRAGLRGFCNDV